MLLLVPFCFVVVVKRLPLLMFGGYTPENIVRVLTVEVLGNFSAEIRALMSIPFFPFKQV